jgi:hypothetical protein
VFGQPQISSDSAPLKRSYCWHLGAAWQQWWSPPRGRRLFEAKNDGLAEISPAKNLDLSGFIWIHQKTMKNI